MRLLWSEEYFFFKSWYTLRKSLQAACSLLDPGFAPLKLLHPYHSLWSHLNHCYEIFLPWKLHWFFWLTDSEMLKIALNLKDSNMGLGRWLLQAQEWMFGFPANEERNMGAHFCTLVPGGGLKVEPWNLLASQFRQNGDLQVQWEMLSQN